jgi:hypothetical protein
MNALTELIRAAKDALESDGGYRYEDADDEIGAHACCHQISYKSHADDCWVPRLRAAVAKAEQS